MLMLKRLLISVCVITIFLQADAQEAPDYFMGKSFPASFHFADREKDPYLITEFTISETDAGLLNRADLHRFINVKYVKVSFQHDSVLQVMFSRLALLPSLQAIEIEEYPFYPGRNITFKNKPFPNGIQSLGKLRAVKFTWLKNYDWNDIFTKLSPMGLVQLNLYISYFDSLPVSLLKLTTLQTLEISGNEVLRELSGWLTQMQGLRSIAIGGNTKMDYNQALSVIAKIPVTQLDIGYSTFEQTPTSLAAIKTLQTVSAKMSRIKDADGFFNALTQLPYLKTLVLDGIDSMVVPASIGQLKNLEQLSLTGRRITVLPVEIGNLQQLRKISLQSNHLEELPESFYGLRKLESVDLSYNKIDTISPSIGSLRKVTYLNLSNNRLTTLPAEIENLVNCKTLNLTSNKLIVLPAGIASFSNLEDLAASDNQLQQLFTDCSGLKKLNRLDASNNRISSLPPSIGQLAVLEHLLLNNNLLEKLPASISALKKLKSLSLNQNLLRELPADLGNLTALEELGLSSGRAIARNLQWSEPKTNSFVYLPASLSNLKNIRTVSLINNTSMDGDSALRILLRMRSPAERIDMTNANIHSLPESGWDSCTIRYLDLSNNHISVIPQNILQVPATLRYFRLRENPVPPLFNRTFESKEQLLVTAVEAGMLKDYSLLPQTPAICDALVGQGNGHYSGRRFEKALSLYNLADSLCPGSRDRNMRMDYLGITQYETGRYREAINNLSKYLAKDTAQMMRVLNFIDPAFQALALSYLGIGDTMQAFKTYTTWSRFSSSAHASTEAALLQLTLGDQEQSDQLFMKSAALYRWRRDKAPLTLLSILEVFVMAGREDSVTHFMSITDTTVFNPAQKQLLQYLLQVNAIRKGNITESSFYSMVGRAESIPEQKISWSYALLESWAHKSALPAEWKQRILDLTNAIKNKLHN